jgi:hypothetical protein
MLAREVGALNNTTRLLLVAAKAYHSPGTFHSRHIGANLEWAKGNSMLNDIYKQYGAGMRVAFDGTRYLEGGHISRYGPCVVC